jgi:protein-disulfide isomerase
MNKKTMIISVVIILIGGFLAGAWYYKNQLQKDASSAEVSEKLMPIFNRGTHAVYGNPDAKVILTEFFDPTCGACARFAPHAKAIVDQSEGKVKLIYRYMPLHNSVEDVLRLLEATRAQNKFDESLALLLNTVPEWTGNHRAQADKALEVLKRIEGLDLTKLMMYSQSPIIGAAIAQDKEDAGILNINQTPTFYVNGKILPQFGLSELQMMVRLETERLYAK